MTDRSAILRSGRDLTGRHVLAFVIIGLLANLAFNLFIASKGFGAPHNSSLFGHPFNSFLYNPYDRFGDTLKMAMSYSGSPIHATDPQWGLGERLDRFAHHLNLMKTTQINQFHMLPLSTLIGLGLRWAISAIDPAFVLAIALSAAAVFFVGSVVRSSAGRENRICMGLAALLCYPAVYAFDRGHLFSLICAATLMLATARCLRDRRADAATILLFAIAINIRPNVGILPLGLFLCGRGLTFRHLIVLAATSLVLFAAGMAVTNALYPAYSLKTLIAGLRDYSVIYVIGDLGQNHNSSLFGALRGLYGYRPWTAATPLVVTFVILAATWLANWRRPVPDAPLLYLLLSAYALGGQVFFDYHLMVFLLPVALLAWERSGDRTSDRMVFIGSCLMLIPKNYIFHVTDGKADWTMQVIFNPLILLLTSVFLLIRLFTRQSEQELGRSIVKVAA